MTHKRLKVWVTHVFRTSILATLAAGTLILTASDYARGEDNGATALSEKAPTIHSIAVDGSIDPPGRVEALLNTVASPGTPLVASGDADRVGIPIGTVARLKRVLEIIGYSADVAVASEGDSVKLRIHLRAFDRVRRIYVSGNQPFISGPRQQDLIGKLSIRPGQKLPPSGLARDTLIASEADHVRDFLRAQGYWEATVRLELHDNGKVPAEINLLVRVELGPAYPLGPLKVTGATAVPTESIEDSFRHGDWHRVWMLPKPFRRSDFRQDMAALVDRYRKIGFPGVRIQEDFDPKTSVDSTAKNVHLGIDIKERRHIEVAFEGNRSRSSGALSESLTLLFHGAYDDVEASASAAAIEHDYHERGHMLVMVKWRRERLSEDSDRIAFIIDEGPELKVRGISFVGNRSIPSDALADVIRTRNYPALGFLGLGEGGYASLRQLELDLQSLIDHYAAVGYPDTKVRAEIAPRPGRWRPLTSTIEGDEEALWRGADSLYVRFVIEESQLVWVAGMRFECVVPGEKLPRDDDFFLDSLRTVAGAPYQPALVRRDENRIKRALGDEGYRYAQVEASSTRYGEQMEIVWRVKLGPQVRVGPIFLRGNFLTTDNTILTWAELRTGDILTVHGFERAQRNLALIQLFNNPNPLSFPTAGTSDAIVPMLIEVEERHDHFGVIRVGGGASTDQAAPGASFPALGVYGALGYEHRNLFGHGWTLTAQGAYGSSLKSATSSFLNPRFLGTLFRLEMNASYLQQATIRLGDVHSGTGSIGFSREMYPGIDANLRYNLRNTSRTELLIRDASTGAFQDQDTVRIGTFVSSLSAGVDWQRLDHALVPARGFKVAVGVEVALPALFFDVGTDTFAKIYGRGFSVVPLLRWLSLRYTIRYDQGLPLGGPALLPKVERYFAGGDTTIRGYQLDHALTETVRVDGPPGLTYVQYRPVGGNLRILQNIDLQFPIAPPLYGALFLDSGLVGYGLNDIAATDFRHGVGFSPLVVKLPVGDLSLSFAVPLNRQPGDDTWRVHFNVGLMF